MNLAFLAWSNMWCHIMKKVLKRPRQLAWNVDYCKRKLLVEILFNMFTPM